MTRLDDSAAFAANWRTVLFVDVAMAVAVCAGGVVLGIIAGWWGWALSAAGFVFLFFAVGRATKWRRLRQRAGL